MGFVQLERKGAITLLQPQGFLAGGQETQALETLLFEAIDRGECPIIDLSRVSFMNSSALETLFVSVHKLSERNMRLKLCCMNRRVKKLFRITLATAIFDLYENREDALASCGAAPGA